MRRLPATAKTIAPLAPKNFYELLRTSDRKSLRRFLGLLTTGFLAIALAPSSGAQEDASVADFFDSVEVNIINVEVYVSDRQGRAVTNLTEEDFEVLEDGKPVEITNFYLAGGTGESPASEPTNTTAESTAGAVTATSASITPPEQRLSVVLFVDHLNTAPQNRDRVVELLRNSPWFSPENRDQVMIAGLDAGGAFSVIQPLTDDHQQLRNALEVLAQTPTGDAQTSLEQGGIIRDILGVSTNAETVDSEAAAVWGSVQAFAQRRHNQVRATVATLDNFVDSLAGLPGRKALVYVSDGISIRPGESLFYAYQNRLGSAGVGIGVGSLESEIAAFDTSSLWRDLSRQANANRVTFYTMLAGGGTSRSPGTLGLREQIWDNRTEAVAASNLRSPMQMVAESTGGLAFTEPKTFNAALDRMRQDFTTYYSLGYTSPRQKDGTLHKVEVRVRNKDWKVRHRSDYRDKTSQESMADRTLSALLFDLDANPLQVKVDVEPGEAEKEDVYRVPVVVKLPISKLLLLPQEHFHHAQISIFVGVRDKKGRTSPIQQVPAPIRIPNDKLLTALGQVAAFEVTLMMRSGEHSVVVGVRDELANVESTTRIAHSPGV